MLNIIAFAVAILSTARIIFTYLFSLFFFYFTYFLSLIYIHSNIHSILLPISVYDQSLFIPKIKTNFLSVAVTKCQLVFCNMSNASNILSSVVCIIHAIFYNLDMQMLNFSLVW